MIEVPVKSFLVVSFLILMSFALPFEKRTKVYLVGDSTIAKKEVKAYPETGWGMPFAYFFDSTVQVDNRAMNGRSTKSFINEGRWKAVTDSLQKGDYVLIQFGHNDEVQTKAASTKPDEFKNYLVKYVTETRNKNSIPVLITPVARRKFDSTGNLVDTHQEYSEIVRTVARQQNVPLIDLDKKSQQVLQQAGVENSKLFFNYLNPNENPNYPEGRQDDTHFNELGARRMAELVLAEIRRLNLDVANRIVKLPVK